MSDSTRRDFLKLGICSAAVCAGATGIAAITGKEVTAAEICLETPAHPWGYSLADLDVEYTRKLGHQGYHISHCSYATFRAIISQMASTVGGPYKVIPYEMMAWGSGGVAGFGSFCGTLNGAAAAIGLICDKGSATSLISALLSWYAETPLPSATANQYAANGEFQGFLDQIGKTLSVTAALPSSVATTNLCHTSVTNWCKESGFASGSSERSERCARLAGDVAAKAVELLNALFNESGIPAYTVPGDKTTCRQCHFKGKDYEAGQFTRGKMDCEACHVDIEDVELDEHPEREDRHDRDHDRDHH